MEEIKTVKYQLTTGDQILRFIQLSCVDQAAAAKKVKFLYKDLSSYVRAQVVTEDYYRYIKKQFGIKG